ncbi:MAG: transposase [Xanthomonadales bacterium]|nr:transposase [Xanthomonadales bacterium]
MSRKRRTHSPDFKSKVALAAIKGDETLSELSRRYQIYANLIVKWKKLLLENSAEAFASGKGLAPDRESEIKSLQAKIGEITMENDFLPTGMYAGSACLKMAA